MRVWADAEAGEADGNADAIVLLNGYGLVRGDGGPKPIDVEWGGVSLARGGNWLVSARGLHDPVVPLLRSTRFDIVDTHTGATTQSVGDSGGQALFTPDTATLVTISGTNLRLWDRREGTERLRLMARAPVERVLIAARGLATQPGLVEWYRAPGAQSLEPVALGDGGGTVMLNGDDGFRRILNLSSDHLHRLRCKVVPRALNDEERATYLGRWARTAPPCAR